MLAVDGNTVYAVGYSYGLGANLIYLFDFSGSTYKNAVLASPTEFFPLDFAVFSKPSVNFDVIYVVY